MFMEPHSITEPLRAECALEFQPGGILESHCSVAGVEFVEFPVVAECIPQPGITNLINTLTFCPTGSA
jgi:hypothetical protein